jgi:hypothetical protein
VESVMRQVIPSTQEAQDEATAIVATFGFVLPKQRILYNYNVY